MALSDCPYDEETGLWVASTRVLSYKCERCGRIDPGFLVTLADHNAGAEIHRHVCMGCVKWYNDLPKKEVL